LNSLKPHDNIPKLAFDYDHDQTEANKSYERAIHIAAHPLSVLEEAKRGTIEPEHVVHLASMYPELKNAIDQKLTEHITEAQLAGKKPPYKTRQGISDVLGIPLSSEMTAENIRAAQATFQSQTPQSSSAGTEGTQSKKPKTKRKSSLSKSDQSFLTGPQALVGRSQRQS
jgi:hypothetical protein